MVRPGVQVTTKGRFFRSGDAELRRAANGMIQEMVKLGEQRLALTLRPRPAGVYLSVSQAGRGKASTGHYRRNLHTMVQDLHGRIDDGGVVYGPWLEGVGSRNQTTRFKGYASFRRTSQWMQKQVPKIARGQVHKFAMRANT